MFPHVFRWLAVMVLAGGQLLAMAAWPVGASRPCVHMLGTAAVLPETGGAVGPPAARRVWMAEPKPQLCARLLLHVLATVFGLRAGLKLFYENTLLVGCVAVVLLDTLVILAMVLVAPWCGGVSALLVPQGMVSAPVMVATLHRFGFTKDRGTVILAVVVAKGLGFLGEVGLRLLFLDAILRYLTALGR
jgi:hypothetical protein